MDGLHATNMSRRMGEILVGELNQRVAVLRSIKTRNYSRETNYTDIQI